MKVTVCFGSVRVVVPCGDGDLLVKDLIRQATLRYKKATGKSSDSWVVVHNLQSQSDGGILDPDDHLNDVADDREQIIANFEDGDGVHHGGGDGASGSSVGTNSPDIFQGEGHNQYPGISRTDIEVTGQQLGTGLLQVRRGSEPALNQLVPTAGSSMGTSGGSSGNTIHGTTPDPSKRWSATPIIVDDADEGRDRRPLHRKESTRTTRLTNGRLSADWCLEQDEDEKSAFSRFVRDGSNRLSMQFLGDSAGGFRWADAAERAAATCRGQSKSLPRDHRRKEPLGQATSNSPVPASIPAQDSDADEEIGVDSVEYVVLHNESGPLGIHVVPDYDRLGKDRGLLVQGIEPGGRIDRDGRLAVYDRIIEINGKNLLNMPFQRVQEIFKGSLLSPELRLRVIKHRSNASGSGTSTAGELLKKPPAPVFPRSISRALDEPVAMVEGEERLVSLSTKVATVSPTKKVSPAHPATRVTTSLLTANTRKIGKKIELELTKGPHGLGFSITTRDNPAGGNCPIYIKNILPKGAAVEDGRLKPGDRLLEVNGVQMTGKTQSEAAMVLRNASPGSKVRIVVSRQEENGGSSPRLPRQIVTQDGVMATPTIVPADTAQDGHAGTRTAAREPPEKVNDDALLSPWKQKEIFTFDIPVHDTEKAGLGVSVKGKTSASHGANHNKSGNNSSVDLGIFVKSVLHGGAASRDGRLRTNDQLLNVNGISLLGQSNSDAMETLRRAMLHTEGPIPGVITLTIARRGGSPGPPGLSNGHQHSQSLSGRDSVSSLLTSSSGTETFGGKSESEGYTPDNSGASENSDNTVIFLPYNHKEEEVGDSSSSNNKSNGKIGDVKSSGNMETVSTRNPVIDRLTGQITNPHALRNESYYRATNETWNTTMLLSGTATDKLSSPTVNQPSGEIVLIEEEYIPHPASHNHRMAKTLQDKASSLKRSDIEPDGQPGTQLSSDQSSETHGADITYASQLSLEESAAGFSRDAFGRQSMSEKRHATLDAKHTDTYQRNKKLREERERQRHMQLQQQQLNDRKRAEMNATEAKGGQELMVRANSIESLISLTRSQGDSEKSDVRGRNEFGPSLGMKKSSSLESLQTMVQEIQMQEDSDPAYTYRNAQGVVRVIRGRGCNESFRAAVDRSYEAPLAELRSRMEMETLTEEDGIPGVPVDYTSAGGGCNPASIPDGRAFGGVRGGPRQSSLNSALDGKHKAAKKKPGLLRGIGSMFRFGKHRKTLDVPLSLALRTEDELGAVQGTEEEQDGEREAARRAAQEEQQRIQEQYRRLMQRQRQMETSNQNTNNVPQEHGSSAGSSDGGSSAVHQREGSTSSSSAGIAPVQSRTERIHQLRAQHQRRHAERRGQYPMDDREERYEEVIRQRLEQPDTAHGCTASYDLYGEMARPGSRVGITDPAKFSHYVNYEEIQQHLNKRKEHLSEIQIMQMRLQVQRQRYKVEEESRRQQHYHSQRRDNRESHRPVSNFYEYESVQTVMRTSQQQRTGPTFAVDANSNSLPRRIQQERIISSKSNNNHNNNGVCNYTQQQRSFQPSCSSGTSSNTYQTSRSNANNANHARASHCHEINQSNHNSAVPLAHNLPQSSRNSGIGTKVNNLVGRTQGPFVTQVMISQQPHPQTPGSKV